MPHRLNREPITFLQPLSTRALRGTGYLVPRRQSADTFLFFTLHGDAKKKTTKPSRDLLEHLCGSFDNVLSFSVGLYDTASVCYRLGRSVTFDLLTNTVRVLEKVQESLT